MEFTILRELSNNKLFAIMILYISVSTVIFFYFRFSLVVCKRCKVVPFELVTKKEKHPPVKEDAFS